MDPANKSGVPVKSSYRQVIAFAVTADGMLKYQIN
jgi:hypothetical protein